MYSFVVQKDLTRNNVIIMWLFRLQECRGWCGWNHGLGSLSEQYPIRILTNASSKVC